MRKILCICMMFMICLSATAVLAAESSGSAVKPQLVYINETSKQAPRAPKLFGQLYLPDEKSENKHIGILMMHPNSNFFNHVMAAPMAERGFTVLISDSRYTLHGDGDLVWDNMALDLKAAMEYLKAVPGIEKTVLIGHSGGGPLSTFYQNIAENGAKAGQGEAKISPASDKLDGLPKADALILLDSHLGYAFAALINKDPAVVVEGAFAPEKTDDSLNMYLEQNGFSAEGSKYDEGWKKKFYAAQAERNQRMLTYALGRLEALEKGESAFSDNEPIVISRNYARLFLGDLSAISHTKGSYPVLSVNGNREEVVKSTRTQGINNYGELAGKADNVSYYDGTLVTDIRTYLSTYAIRTNGDFRLTEDDIVGVDFASSNTSAPANLAGVHVPVLIMGMTSHYWVVPSEINYNHAAASDKTLVFVEGASHSLTPAKPEAGDTVGMIADYARDWLEKRFK